MRNLKNSELFKLVNENLTYLGIIDSSKKEIIYICKEHGKIKQRFDVHIKTQKCSICSVNNKCKKYTKEFLQNLEDNQSRYSYNFTKNIYKTTDKIEIICKEHGSFFQTIHNHFNINNNCPKCSFLIRQKEFGNNELINLLISKGLEVISYKGYRKKSILKCNKHGIIESNVGNAKKYGCFKCCEENRLILEKDKFIKQSKSTWINVIDFDYSTLQYNGKLKKMEIYSQDIGIIKQLPDAHLKGFLPRKSTGELIIEKILKVNNIIYTKEKTFEGCKNKSKLRFDFYLPKLNLCIEYNGIQHYNPVSRFGGQEQLKYQQLNDKIKVDYCKDRHIDLLVISYKDSIVDKIKQIYDK